LEYVFIAGVFIAVPQDRINLLLWHFSGEQVYAVADKYGFAFAEVGLGLGDKLHRLAADCMDIAVRALVVTSPANGPGMGDPVIHIGAGLYFI